MFKQNAETLVETNGWGLLFQLYDADGSGVLDFEEFIGASRHDLKISVATVSNADITRIFESVDLDDSGEIRVISYCHFRKTDTEYDKKTGIKWLSCTEK